MPKGPNGEKRPADAVARVVMIGQIATGEILASKPDVLARTGRAGGIARSETMAPVR